MAISATGGTAANNSGSVTSLALSSYTTTTGRTLVMMVVLGSTGSSVSSSSNSAGSYSWTLKASVNGTGVRVEVWTSPVTTGAATVFTINISGATSVEASLEEYSGVNSVGNSHTGSGSSVTLWDQADTQDGNNWVVSGLGFACVSGDTLTALTGTSRQSSIPAATAVGGALYDNTDVVDGNFGNWTRISNSRNWAAASVELRSGGAAITAADYGGAVVASLQVARDVRYLHCLEPLFCQNQNYPSTPGANNYGFVG